MPSTLETPPHGLPSTPIIPATFSSLQSLPARDEWPTFHVPPLVVPGESAGTLPPSMDRLRGAVWHAHVVYAVSLHPLLPLTSTLVADP
ncbi:hypothetical protein C8Q79DRAFT_945410 [Trametes meyenii]|nr:hypothetical protein C8Q79DRAFT_945410 [Trametes meyenii]